MFANNVSDDIISKIGKLFMEARKSRPGKIYYSEDLRDLVLAAIADGHSAHAVSKAAGVSKSSVYAWRRFKTVGAQTEFALTYPNEALFSFPMVGKGKAEEERKVDRVVEFKKTSGFHQTKDHPSRIDLDFKAV